MRGPGTSDAGFTAVPLRTSSRTPAPAVGAADTAQQVIPVTRSVIESHGAIAGELHQRCGALELSVLDELPVVEVALLEADGADVEAAALLDELGVDPLDRRILVGADAVGVAVESEAYAVRCQPEHDVLALVEGRSRGEI